MIEENERPLRKILVGYDGSEQARRALEFATALGSRSGDSEIHIAYVVRKPGGVPDPIPDEVMDSLTAMAREELRDAAREVKKSLVTPVTHLEAGNPGERLVSLAESIRPDLVVLGIVQHSASDRLLGTVSSFFLKSRKFPVLIVP